MVAQQRGKCQYCEETGEDQPEGAITGPLNFEAASKILVRSHQ
jgi:hypothetical protein